MSAPRIVIIGAGPTGIGAAWRLTEHGHDNWHLVDAAGEAGGLACSIVDPAGFTWDIGGHVLFSHYKWFDRLMKQALGDDWVEHEREAWVWIRGRWVPYPFQNNLWRLPPEDIEAAVRGLEAVAAAPKNAPPPANFREWLLRSFGDGLCDLFMLPYNRKVWACDPSAMNVQWMGERVATVDLARVKRNIEQQKDDAGWGPNATFRFPLRGGTGAIWRSLHAQLPAGTSTLGRRVTGVHTATRTLLFDDGTTMPYDRLITTMPLDLLLGMLQDQPRLSALAGRFVHSSSHIVGLGFEGKVPQDLRTKCWMYFPEGPAPFYRATVFSNYSPNNVPRPGEQWSLMAEVSESATKPVNHATVLDDVIHGFRAARMIPDDAVFASKFHVRLEHGYPTPWLTREAVLGEALPALQQLGIYSRGRFGAWRYEVANQDHSALQGVEAVDHILLGTPETTVNGRMDVEPEDLRT